MDPQRSRDPALLSALDDFARIDPVHAREALGLAVPHDIEWVAARLGLLPSSVDPNGEELRDLAVRTRDEDLTRLLDGVCAAGPDFVSRLCRALRAPDALPHQVARLRPFLAAHPAFSSQLSEGYVR